jgi:hypothetical protein
MALLNMWRRLWMVWACVSIAVALWLTIQTAPFLLNFSGLTFWREEERRAREQAYQSAYRRSAGEAPQDSSPGSAEKRLDALRLLWSEPDEQLREDNEDISAEFGPKTATATTLYRRLYVVAWGAIWVALVGGSYIAGATVAWIRRGSPSSADTGPRFP